MSKRILQTSRIENLRYAAKKWGVSVRQSRNPQDPKNTYVLEGQPNRVNKLVAHFNEEVTP